MGAKMVTLSVTTSYRDCKTDADCWEVSTNPVMVALTTDAEKEKSCC